MVKSMVGKQMKSIKLYNNCREITRMEGIREKRTPEYGKKEEEKISQNPPPF